MADPEGMDRVDVNVDALKSEIRRALINQKANACPIAMRMAWHAAGTYDKSDGSGGCNGATMRWQPQVDDEANKGLHILKDLMLPVKQNHPEISLADLWAFAGCCGIEFLGGPKIPFKFGRRDDQKPYRVPPNGRLPDASQGAEHLRAIFGRMGFNDREIVALSGGHTLGRMHEVRSGYDLPWTHGPLKFDNSYYKHLMELEWKKRDWHGKDMFTDVATGRLGMLPTDMALKTDPSFRQYAQLYARDEKQFFHDFAWAYAKLISLGCPPECDPTRQDPPASELNRLSAEFRDYAMHGSIAPCKTLAKSGKVDVHQVEPTSGRTALHKAAFWAHFELCRFLLYECKIDPNVQDIYGDTALHDTARFGNVDVARLLAESGADLSIRNKHGKTAQDVAEEHSKLGAGGHKQVVQVLNAAGRRSRL